MELLAVIGSCTVLGLPILREIRQQKRRAASGAPRLDQMNAQQFEEYAEIMMRRLGYHVERPRTSGEGKMDSDAPAFIVSTNGLQISVRTKHDGQPVDAQAIQSAITAQETYGCSDTMIICSEDFLASAHTLARSANVILWAKNDVEKAALSIQRQSSPAAGNEHSESGYSREYLAQAHQSLA